MQKRADISDYFAHLSDDQLPHLEKLRELSRAAAPDLVETLHWNNPAYLKDDVTALLPRAPAQGNGKRVACIGAGPASLAVANDLLPLGYHVTIFEKLPVAGGLMRSNIPSFRLPGKVLDDEIGMILGMGNVEVRYSSPVDSMKRLLDAGYDAVFVGSGAPRGKNLEIPGRYESDRIHIRTSSFR